MGDKGDRLGHLLVRAGVLDESALQDLLRQQQRTLPLASMAYVLGYAGEASLVRGLARQAGLPGVVFEGSKIDLALLDAFDSSWLSQHTILPVHRDERCLFLAVSDPGAVQQLSRQIEFDHDVTVVIHTALHVALARAIRIGLEARARGQRYLIGTSAEPNQVGPAYVVATTLEAEDENRVAGPVSARHKTREGDIDDLLEMATGVSGSGEFFTGDTKTVRQETSKVEPTYDRAATQLDFDSNARHGATEPDVRRILIVDDNESARDSLEQALSRLGYDVLVSSGGRGTLDILRENTLSAVILDAMLPDIDGFQLCRAIKRSRRYGHIPVVLMSALLGSEHVNEKVLQKYGADAYFVKPLDLAEFSDRLSALLESAADETDDLSIGDDTFDGAMASFRAGRIPEAIEQLRLGIEDDPLSPKHHFLLANLLQGQGEVYEAIAEYETVVDLCPDYFPALTRLAYLYYEKGHSAKAVDTWQRSLDHCKDQEMRVNIETFMRKLMAKMQSEG